MAEFVSDESSGHGTDGSVSHSALRGVEPLAKTGLTSARVRFRPAWVVVRTFRRAGIAAIVISTAAPLVTCEAGRRR